MSSDAESLKQAASEPSSEEPTSKKVKIKENEPKKDGNVPNEKSSDNNNIPATEGKPTKNVNGAERKDKQQASAEANVVNEIDDDGEDDDDDDDDDIEDIDGDIDHLGGVFDPKVARSLSEVESIQMEICALNEKASEEILKVEQKFNKLRRPYFEKRNDLLKTITRFWLNTLINHPIIAPMIENVEEEECLKHIVNLDIEEFEDVKSGYKLRVYFAENPFITNSVIVKEFHILDSEEMDIKTTPVEYKNTPEAKSLQDYVAACNDIAKRSRRPDDNQLRSFFAWLINSCKTSSDDVAEILKDQIWPNPLEYFFAGPTDVDDDDDDDDDDEDGVSDDDDSNEDDDLDDEDIDEEEDNVIPENYADVSSEDELEDDTI